MSALPYPSPEDFPGAVYDGEHEWARNDAATGVTLRERA